LVLRASLHNEPEEAPGIAIPPSVPYEGELSSMLPFCDTEWEVERRLVGYLLPVSRSIGVLDFYEDVHSNNNSSFSKFRL